eukprot:GGOE01021894.1.p2 GENE.GGOE01021894.1~~GGOE01021894.1.p2  ORF type:complete len:141 (-),score=34.77 GGOE01021894.1:473-850(-)
MASDTGGLLANDVDDTLLRLEAHWSVVEAELTEINRDIAHCQACILKYGATFEAPLTHLRRLKGERKATLRAILTALETFTQNMEDTRQLVSRLDQTTFAAPASPADLTTPTKSFGNRVLVLPPG